MGAGGSAERSNGTQRAVDEVWRRTGGKYNIMCIKSGNSYDASKLKGMHKREVSFNNALSLECTST